MQKFDLPMMHINIVIILKFLTKTFIEVCLNSVQSMLQLRSKLSKLLISESNFIWLEIRQVSILQNLNLCLV